MNKDDRDELDALHAQLQTLISHRIEDIRADVRAARARATGILSHPALTVGDAAALIEIRQTLSDIEDRLQRLQIERGKRTVH